MSTVGRGHRSSISQKSVSQFLSDTEELSDQELIRQVNELKHNIKILTLENEVFEKTIMRLEPTLMQGVQNALEFATKLQSSSSLNVGSFVKSKTSTFGLFESGSPSRMLTSPSRISNRKLESIGRVGGTIIFGTGPRINVLERAELVATEIEILMKNLDKVRKKTAKQHAMLKAQLEEIGVRVSDVDKSVASFQQQVIVEGWDKIAQRIPAEIWIRFMTEWVKLCDGQIGKLRLRTSTLNTQFSKLRGQIKVKAELSESLRPVDFEKLKIENDECLKSIEQKLHQLEELKKMTGDANLNLTIHKKAMVNQNNYLNNVLKTTKNKNRQTVEIDKETEVITTQADALAHRLEEVRKVRLAYLIPDIMEYVGVKAEVADLKHSIKILGNRLHIQKIALQSLNKKLHSMCFHESTVDQSKIVI